MSGVRISLVTVAFSILSILIAPSLESFAQPRISATLSEANGKALHVTVRTQEGLERFVFTPRRSPDINTRETHYQGFARTRNFQRERLPSALTITESRAWVFFSSRRTGRPVAATIDLHPEAARPSAKRVRISRVPKQKVECGSHAGEDEHTPSTARAAGARRINRPSQAPKTAKGQRSFSPARVLEIATMADFDFYQAHGANTNAYIRAVLNAVDGIYASSLGIRLKVTSQRVETAPQGARGVISAISLLEEFRTSSFAASSTADIRHLFTGRTIEGLTIGIAYVGAVCTAGGRYGVGLSNVVSAGLQPYLAAHEIAHNLSATHDNEPQSIMNPAITEANNRFSAQTLSNMYGFVSSTGSCLSSEQLSDVQLALDSTDPTKFAARVSFSSQASQECGVVLYGSADGRRFIPLASARHHTPGNSTGVTATFSANTPRLSGQQTFFFKARVSCGSSRTFSAPAKLRYGLATSGSGNSRGNTRWLEALKRNLNS